MTTPFDRLLQRAYDDRAVSGLVVGGSRGKGLGTDLSDWDVYVVVRAEDDVLRVRDDLSTDVVPGVIDLCSVFTVDQFEKHAAPGDSEEWNRYNFAHLVPSLDRTPGRVLQRLCDEKEWLPEQVATARAGVALDAFLNSYYRALKNERDGNQMASSLDAAESVPWVLEFVFTVERRVRPYNKFLAWEVRTHPLERQWGPAGDVTVPLLNVVQTGSLAALAAIFRYVESGARDLDLGGVVDAWGDWAVAAMREGTARR